MNILNLELISSTNNKITNAISTINIGEEQVDLLDSIGRVLSQDIYSPIDLPQFNRSIYDGYAVFASDVINASIKAPVILKLSGTVQMGKTFDQKLEKNHAIYVPTGGIIPINADAIVMIEYANKLEDDKISVFKSSEAGFGIAIIGEDMKKESIVLKSGSTLRAQDVGALCAIGKTKISVCKKPRFAIFSTGNEIIPPNQTPKLGEIRDINSSTIAALVSQEGGEVMQINIIKDDYNLIKTSVEKALEICDVIIISGGSSVGKDDKTAQIIGELGEPGLLTQGMAIKPGKPTIVGKAQNKMLFGLPGHPCSSIMVFQAIVKPMIHQMLGKSPAKILSQTAILCDSVRSDPQKQTYQSVKLVQEDNKILAKPVWGKSGSIMVLCDADGYIIIPVGQSGEEKNKEVEVFLF